MHIFYEHDIVRSSHAILNYCQFLTLFRPYVGLLQFMFLMCIKVEKYTIIFKYLYKRRFLFEKNNMVTCTTVLLKHLQRQCIFRIF